MIGEARKTRPADTVSVLGQAILNSTVTRDIVQPLVLVVWPERELEPPEPGPSWAPMQLLSPSQAMCGPELADFLLWWLHPEISSRFQVSLSSVSHNITLLARLDTGGTGFLFLEGGSENSFPPPISLLFLSFFCHCKPPFHSVIVYLPKWLWYRGLTVSKRQRWAAHRIKNNLAQVFKKIQLIKKCFKINSYLDLTLF